MPKLQVGGSTKVRGQRSVRIRVQWQENKTISWSSQAVALHVRHQGLLLKDLYACSCIFRDNVS